MSACDLDIRHVRSIRRGIWAAVQILLPGTAETGAFLGRRTRMGTTEIPANRTYLAGGKSRPGLTPERKVAGSNPAGRVTETPLALVLWPKGAFEEPHLRRCA
jgi:hypothetical protein